MLTIGTWNLENLFRPGSDAVQTLSRLRRQGARSPASSTSITIMTVAETLIPGSPRARGTVLAAGCGASRVTPLSAQHAPYRHPGRKRALWHPLGNA